MRKILHFFSAFLVFLALSAAHAQEEKPDFGFGGAGIPGAATEKSKTVAKLIPEVSAVQPGKPFTVALLLSHPEGWHSYFANSGGIEQPVTIQWTLPEGASAGPLQYPVPHVHEGPLNKGFIFEGSPVFLIEITPPASLKPDSKFELKGKAAWQICNPLNCVDEDLKIALSLPVKAAAEIDAAQSALFAQARAEGPASPAGWNFRSENAGKQVRLLVTPPAGTTMPTDIDFIPEVRYLASVSQGSTVSQQGGDWVFTLNRVTENVLGKIEQGKEVSGMLVSKSALDTKSGAHAVLVPSHAFSKPPAKPLSLADFLPVLGGMLIGGLILNLMPCVFPVLGLKIMGFVQQSGQDRRKVAMHGFAFAIGVLISFWVISGILFVLRENSTAEIGWGYQLQNKWFVYGLVMLFYVFGLSMFGLFEIGASATGVGGKLQSKDGLTGSFFSGVLATIAATPCSAPILGPAIGAAIVLPTVQFFTAFTVMALGLALPYLLLSLFPKLIDMLPRPGAWMESFKQAMSFLLIGAAGFFFWVYMDHVEPDVLLLVIFGMVFIAMAGWIYGRWATPYRSAKARNIGRFATVLFAALGFYLATGPYKGLHWERWSQGKVDDYLDKDVPVYVDFTAKWCATCQVNKKVAYTPEVVALFKERGIIPLRADKTKPDPEIDAKVAEFGRAAIPVNVLYVPGKDPIVTPEILTPDYMKELIIREVPLSTKGDKTP
ncbi:thioredoxin family protein [Haloferula sp. BvORR071]|uniref:protein-disulfide reductase DsbD family protein n=1 Tax=Haloferula sp. BvORR071 TaxID=1396141 RepID=UPI0005559C73|nr:thioredoxin family protein [Haloferula sp. BvORR071]